MDALTIFAILAGLIGIIGSIAPALPGPPLGWVGMLLIYFHNGSNAAGEPMSLTLLFIWLGITIFVSILDYVIPAYLTKVTGGTKYASWGAMIGLFAGMLLPPVGIILGSILGAFLGEMFFAGKDLMTSLKSSAGAFIGFMLGTGLKLIVSGVMLYYIILYI